ncbi:hypothetical protein ACWD4F_11820 [Streptomyces aureus]
MEYELRAEYAGQAPPESSEARVALWHMTGVGETLTLCRRRLDPAAWTQPSSAWGTDAADPFCPDCGVKYLRMNVG